ncbi:hypothetical protein [Flavisolibacter nicotianae]|nr:hypothetical protein [Flavisolibacter nicotianae]
MRQESNSDWGYDWIPIMGPFIVGALTAAFYHFLKR